MTRDYLQLLAEAPTKTQRLALLGEMEDQLTPLELQAIVPKLLKLGRPMLRPVLRSQALHTFFREVAEPYEVTSLTEDLRLFRDPSVERGKKSLLLAFCGATNRMNMPSSLFVQSLPASQFDIALIADDSELSFERGIRGVPLSFVPMMRRIAEMLGAERYRALYCCGVSMGGLPALRAGRLLGAKRSLSVGGTYHWSIRRDRATGELLIPAFDPLCACATPARGELVVATTSFSREVRAAEKVRRVVPVRLMPFPQYETHNLLYPLLLEGKLAKFLASVFDFDPSLANRSRRRSPLLGLGGLAWDLALRYVLWKSDAAHRPPPRLHDAERDRARRKERRLQRES